MPHPHRLSDKDFKKIFSSVPRLCVDVLITHEKKVLLSKRTIEPYKGFWHLPGGTVYFGESLAEAARRIAKDETGLRVAVNNAVGFGEFLGEIKLAGRHSVSIVMRCSVKSGKLTSSMQGEEMDFFSQLPSKILKEQKKIINTWRNA